MSTGDPGLWARLEHGLRRDPARPALGFRPSQPEAFEWLSHGRLADRCQALATGLRRGFGPPPQDAVIAILKRRDPWWYSYDFAAAAADLVSVGLDAGSTDDVLVGVRPPGRPPPSPLTSPPGEGRVCGASVAAWDATCVGGIGCPA